ncbi:hypothetical protein FHS41_003440 [Streptomyces violarus]|uniref:Uncharacterized protein n=1 Tax=Streptomyces violarus TaxID=67380 RepID=A0A7W5F1U5_9ACTN|nr:hypothetical protein [Streptomyces violarus]
MAAWHPDIRASAIMDGDGESVPGAVRVLTGTDGSVF